MANYVGAIAVNRKEGLVAATSPRGGTYVVLDAISGTLVHEVQLPGASGICRRSRAVSAYRRKADCSTAAIPVNWDQHVVRIG